MAGYHWFGAWGRDTLIALPGLTFFAGRQALGEQILAGMGAAVKAHPLEIFIVLLMAGYVGGVVGMLIAIPSYTVIRVFAAKFLSHIKFVRMLTGKL